MVSFFHKKIETIQTLGERLKKHREAKKVSIEKAARRLNINSYYLRFLEKDQYQKLPADVYTINILRIYARFLDLNPGTVTDIFQKEKELYYKTRRGAAKQTMSAATRLMNHFLNPRVLRYLAIFLALVAMFGYLGFAANKIVSPPKLVILAPADNFLSASQQVEIRGQTEKEVQLKINNRLFLSDQAGNFNLTLDLPKGLNIIKISAQKKHSREQVVYRKVVVDEGPIASLTAAKK